MLRNSLKTLLILASVLCLPGCAVLWVADKALDTAVFAGKTTAKAGVAAAELTWGAGAAVVGDEPEDKEEKGG